VWLAFVPTYFTAFYAEQKALLLAVALLLNSTIMLLCLYAPKIYAIFYVDEESMNLKVTATMNIPTGNRVAPTESTSYGNNGHM